MAANRPTSRPGLALVSADGGLDALQSEWDELLEHSDQGAFFLRWRWNRSWWRMYAPAGSRLYLVLFRDSSRRLDGLAPLFWQQSRHWGLVRPRVLQFLGTGIDVLTSEYLDVIARRGHEPAVGAAIGTFLRSRTDWDRLCLWHIPVQSAVLPHIRAALGPRAAVAPCDRAPYISTEAGWEDIKHGFGRNLRGNIDRLVRQVQRAPGFSFDLVRTVPELKSALDELVRLHQARWQSKGQPGSFALARFESFLREITRDALAAGRLRLWRLTLDGQCVATLLAFFDFGIVHYFQSGFDPASSFSLGKATIALAVRDCATSSAVRRFDFMGGKDAYKTAWTQQVRELCELEVLRSTPRAAAFRLGRTVRNQGSRVRRWMR